MQSRQIARVGSPAYEPVDSWADSEIIARVLAPPPLVGEIWIPIVSYWDDVSGKWIASRLYPPPEVLIGSMIGFRSSVWNGSDVTVNASLYSWVRYPNGSRHKHCADYIVELAPDGEALMPVTFPALELGGKGDYIVEEIYLEFEEVA